MSEDALKPFRLGPVTVEPARCVLERDGEEVRLEPKVVDLLVLLSNRYGAVVSRDALFDALWPGTIVGDDALSRTVFKLRRALGDDPKTPRFVETVPKRGYRLLVAPTAIKAPVSSAAVRLRAFGSVLLHRRLGVAAACVVFAVGIAFALLQGVGADLAAQRAAVSDTDAQIDMATDRYMRFTRADNEAAIVLYQRALSDPEPDPAAEAGMAAALVQRVVRWPATLGSADEGADSLRTALQRGLTRTPQARDTLRRARSLAERAVRRAPREADNWRVLGLVRTAGGDMAGAFEAYERGLREEPRNWAIRINLAELYQMQGRDALAHQTFASAYEAMGEAYADEPQRAGLWRAPLGVLIAETGLAAGRIDDSEAWYRRVLADEPFYPDATEGLASVLAQTGRAGEAAALCAEYESRTGAALQCGG